MKPVQIAETLLKAEGAGVLLAMCGTGSKGDIAPLRVAMLRMFPNTPYDDLEAGLRLALSVARLDQAEEDARPH